MHTFKSIAQLALAIALGLILLPVFVWLGLAAVGACVAAAIVGGATAAWKVRQARRHRAEHWA